MVFSPFSLSLLIKPFDVSMYCLFILRQKLKTIITFVEMYKNEKVITNKNKSTYDTQKKKKKKHTKNKSIKPF